MLQLLASFRLKHSENHQLSSCLPTTDFPIPDTFPPLSLKKKKKKGKKKVRKKKENQLGKKYWDPPSNQTQLVSLEGLLGPGWYYILWGGFQ